MECRQCGNKEKFQAIITDYRPAEIWAFSGAGLGNRYCQADSGDLEIKVACLACNSKDVDHQGFELESHAQAKLETLSEEEWDKLVGA